MTDKDNTGHVERLFHLSKYTEYVNAHIDRSMPKFPTHISVCEYTISHLNDKAIIIRSFDCESIERHIIKKKLRQVFST